MGSCPIWKRLSPDHRLLSSTSFQSVLCDIDPSIPVCKTSPCMFIWDNAQAYIGAIYFFDGFIRNATHLTWIIPGCTSLSFPFKNLRKLLLRKWRGNPHPASDRCETIDASMIANHDVDKILTNAVIRINSIWIPPFKLILSIEWNIWTDTLLLLRHAQCIPTYIWRMPGDSLPWKGLLSQSASSVYHLISF